MDRARWTSAIHDFKAPPWPCPHCNPGTLSTTKDEVRVSETPASKGARDDDAWEPDWIEEVFSATLRCGNPSCGGTVEVVGTGAWHADYDFDHDVETWYAWRTPISFMPPLRMIEIPRRCPADVRTQLEAAFALYWSDTSASGNRIRGAVEYLLTHFKVPRFKYRKVGGGRKRHRASLAERIDDFGNKNPDLADHLHAIRWLGNAGSHEGPALSSRDVLDGLEIVESVLDDLFVGTAGRISAMVHEINRRKKPRSTRKVKLKIRRGKTRKR